MLQCLVPFSCCVMNLAFASFAPAMAIPFREFSVLSLFFFAHINVASSSYSVKLLPAFCRPSYPRLLISYPHPAFPSSTSRSRVKPSATTGPADEKEISSLSFSSVPFPPLPYIPSFSIVSIARLCVILRRNNVAAKPGQSSFLNLSWDNRLGVII